MYRGTAQSSQTRTSRKTPRDGKMVGQEKVALGPGFARGHVHVEVLGDGRGKLSVGG
jgi:hypothetical protein